MFSVRRYILRRSARCCAVTLLVVGFSTLDIFAADKQWTGGTNTTWSTSTNWTGGAPGSTDNAEFNGTFTNQPNLTASATVGGVWFTNGIGQNTAISLSGGTALSINGNTINGISGLGILVDNTNSFTLTISAPVTLGGTQIWRNNSANLFTVSGALNTNAQALTIDGTGNDTLSGVISGSGAITLAGTGNAVTFSNTGSTYSGQLAVKSGTLKIDTANNSSNNGELGNSSTSVILGSTGGNTGTLEYTGATASSSKKFTMATGGTGAFQIDTAGTTLTLSGVIDGGGGLTKTGAGTLTLTAADTYSGATIINAGTLTLGGVGGLAGAIGSTSSITINNAATLVIDNSDISGTNRGVNRVGSAPVTMNGGTLYFKHDQVNGNPAYATSVGAVSLSSGASTIKADLQGNKGSTLTIASLSRSVGATVDFTGTQLGGAGDANTIKFTTAPTLVNGILPYATANGSDWATHSGNATPIVAYSAYTTGTNPAAWVAANNVSLTGNPSANVGTQSINSLRLAGTSTVTIGGGNSLTLSSGGLLATGTGANTITGGTLKGASGGDLIVIQNSTGNLTIGSVIADSTSATALTKSGSGTLVLTGTNTYTGTTYINSGTLQIGSGGTAGTLGSGGVTGNATLSFNRSDAISVSNVISGSGNVGQTGSGTTTLTGSNTYTGATSVNAGTLLVSNASGSGTGTGAVTVNNTGTLGGTGTISGGVTVASGGTVNPGPSGAAGSAAAVGTLHTGALTLQSGSFSNFDVATPTNFDKLISSAAITFGGTLDVNIASGQTFTAGQTLDLFTGTSESGTFTGIVDGQVVFYDGYAFTADYTATGFNLVAVPEPSTWFAAGLALVAVGWSQRERIRASYRLIVNGYRAELSKLLSS